MAIKLSILKTGEYIISEVLQANETDASGNSKVICYVFKQPRTLIVLGMDQENKEELSTQVSLLTWPQFTKADEVEIFPDAVITIVEPTPDLVQLYKDSIK